MSRVFAAEETSLKRKVVVKVLAPELAVDVNTERFRREIQLAAQLQQANIVPVLSTGETGGLPYYTMPLVDGHSLRARLSNGGPLSVTEAVGILRDVAKALAYAHEHGVVHRDIKPENVLLSGGTAVVTDFGIAKALSASRTGTHGETLTQVGVSLGTPAYMAPEQAAADPETDHRADLYAFGIMGYELLSGHPPFHGRTPQKLLAAQMGETPEPIGEIRPDTPPLLAELVMKCLAKDADSRPQSAGDLVRVLETVTSGGGHPAMPAILLGGRRRLTRALLLYAGSFVAVAILARAAIVGIGLPDWVFPGALVVMALGLPVILFTAFVHHGAHQAMTAAALTPGGSRIEHSTFTRLAVKASPWVSWRRTALGGAIALGVFGVLVAGYMTLRAFGIGPAGSLLGAGVLKSQSLVLLDDFRGPPSDSTLGAVVTEAFRTDFAQSDAVKLVDPERVARVLKRMEHSEGKRLDLPLAREVAVRVGIPAVIDGDVSAIGQSYVLSVRLVTADSGRELAAFRESAEGTQGVIPAIDRLSKRLRAKIGESLRTVRASPPIEEVTTGSLEALRKYVQAVRAREEEGDPLKAQALLKQAILLDTGFAMAYRKLGVVYEADLGLQDEATVVLKKAMDNSGRLSDVERNLTIAAYYGMSAERDVQRSLAGNEAVLELQPDNETALINGALDYEEIGNYPKAIDYLRRSYAIDSGYIAASNLSYALGETGQVAERSRQLEETERRFPGNPQAAFDRGSYLALDGKLDSGATLARRLIDQNPANTFVQSNNTWLLSNIAGMEGRYAESERLAIDAAAIDQRRGLVAAPLVGASYVSFDDIWFRENKQRGLERLDEALRQHPLDSVPPLQRPYWRIAALNALGGRPAQARAVLSAMDRAIPAPQQQSQRYQIHGARGEIALAEHRPDEAIAEFRQSAPAGCPTCPLPAIGRAYDLAGNADSTIAVFERYLAGHSNFRIWYDLDRNYRAGIYKRLGELYDAKGDRESAIKNYAAFVEYWKKADPEFQPKVAAARQRMAHLQSLGKQ